MIDFSPNNTEVMTACLLLPVSNNFSVSNGFRRNKFRLNHQRRITLDILITLEIFFQTSAQISSTFYMILKSFRQKLFVRNENLSLKKTNPSTNISSVSSKIVGTTSRT